MQHLENVQTFQDWLNSKPRGWSGILSARAALRVLPHLHFLIPVSQNRGRISNESINYLIPLFRCHIVASIAGAIKLPAQLSEMAEAAKLASDMAKKAKTSPFYNALADSIRVPFASKHEEAARFASQAYFHAASAGLEAARFAISQDIRILEESEEEQAERTLLLSPLWVQKSIPSWEAKSWTIFEDKLRKIGNDWHIWADWYGGGKQDGISFPGILQGATDGHYIFNLKVEEALQLYVDIAKIDAARWDVAPWKINAHIRSMIEDKAALLQVQEELGINVEMTSESIVTSDISALQDEGRPALQDEGRPALQDDPVPEKAVEITNYPKSEHITHNLDTLIIRQKVLISAITTALPVQSGTSLKAGLDEYLGEINTRGQSAIVGVLQDLYSVIEVGSKKMLQDGMLEPATSEAFARFKSNHDMIIQLISKNIKEHTIQT